jgi:hypothetical protein
MKFASFVGKSKLLVFSMFGGCLLLAFEGFPHKCALLKTLEEICTDCIGGGYGLQSRSAPRSGPLQILNGQAPFQIHWKLLFPMFGGWCVRIGMVFALTTTEIEIFKTPISKKKKNKNFMWGGAMLFKHRS